MASVLYEKRGAIAVITLNRPEAHNALDPETVVRLADAWQRFADDDGLRVAVVTGSGEKTFCAGADLGRLIPLMTGARQPEDEYDHKLAGDMGLAMRALLRNFDPGKPIIAALNGSAWAGGLELMQATDMRVAAEGAKLALREVQHGLFPIGGSTVRLPRQLPWAVAMEVLLTGEPIDAARACALGLVNAVRPRAEVLPEALRIAERIAANAPLAVRAVRRSARECVGLSEADGMDRELAIGMPVFATRDAREGPRAFKEKRTPRFEGR